MTVESINQDTNIRKISPKEFWQKRQSGEHIDLLDVRTSSEFDESHIEVAWSVPLESLDTSALKEARGNTSGSPLYLICQSGLDGENAIKQLVDAGFTQLVKVEGGPRVWESEGLPIVKKMRKVFTLDQQLHIGVGIIAAGGALLALTVSLWFAIIPVLVGAALIYSGFKEEAVYEIMAKLPWNRDRQNQRSAMPAEPIIDGRTDGFNEN